ncbi:sigma-70 family RNA polymerase sigma factor [candidate division KSB1 bacterium]|nr:sigma-70 family RNA polymerase sigma factor [candidate division KSB1 bacterium]
MNQDTEITELVTASQNGDQAAMAKLVNIYAPTINGLIYTITGDAQVTEDLAQDTFLKALMALGNYQARASFKSWLFRIAINVCKDHFRRKKVRGVLSYWQNNESDALSLEKLKDDIPTPWQKLKQKETIGQIMAAIEKLPTSLRTVFALREIQELSYNEITQVLKWQLGTVKSRLYRARKLLAQELLSLEEEIYEQ